jgi:hypothetical protein
VRGADHRRLYEDPVNGITLNPAYQGEIRGWIEYVGFVFLTRSGTPTGPPSPLQFNSATSGGGPASRQACRTWHCRGAVCDALVAAAAGHGLPLATRDRRPTGHSMLTSRYCRTEKIKILNRDGCLRGAVTRRVAVAGQRGAACRYRDRPRTPADNGLHRGAQTRGRTDVPGRAEPPYAADAFVGRAALH